MIPQDPDADQRRFDAHCTRCGEYLYLPGEATDADDLAEWQDRHEDCTAIVNLDPEPELPPAVARWNELVGRAIVINHDGDASKIIPFPRPPWSDDHLDVIGRNLSQSFYNSDYARIPLAYSSGLVMDEYSTPASMNIRGRMGGDGIPFIGLSKHSVVDGNWQRSEGVALTPAEATELAHALLAAVDLIGGEK